MDVITARSRVRISIHDLGEENWTNDQIYLALENSVRYMRNQFLATQAQWFTDVVALTATDFETVGSQYTYSLPVYMERVHAVYLDEELKNKLAHEQRRAASNLTEGWRVRPGYKRMIQFPVGNSEIWLEYVPRLSSFHSGTCGIPVGNAIPLTVVDGAMSVWENAYRDVPFLITVGANAGYQMQPMASAGANITLDVAPPALNTQTYAMELPFDGRADEAICAYAGVYLLTGEGHRRQQEAMMAQFQLALEEFANSIPMEGEGDEQVERTY